MKKGDVILIVFLLIIISVGYGAVKISRSRSNSINKVAVIKHNELLVQRIELDTVESLQRIEVTDSNGRSIHVILVDKGRIRFIQSDCPNQVCVNTGWLTQEGDMAACLPNRTVIVIENQSKQIDNITY